MSATALGSRAEALEKLTATTEESLDVLVVGGGITGAGAALDAASRGLKVGLVERFDFAAGTSSKSSKLVHGGLRYLEQREFGLMREAAQERDLMRRLAPHLVEPIAFALPVTSRLRRAQFGVGLWAYDALASFRNLKVHRYLDGPETEQLVPVLPPGKVRGGFLFYDCKTDDARLTLEVLIQARRLGATVVNHAAVRDMTGGETCSAVVENTLDGSTFEVRARRIVVAAGVWSDRLEAIASEGSHPRLRPSKGVHLVFRRDALPMADTAAFIPDAERRRMLFVIPWMDAVLVGTTDNAYEGTLDRPAVEPEDRAYCLDAVNAIFGLGLTERDIAGAYAGLRPLIAGKAGATADLSRKHAIYELAPGIVGITGGKLTIYRRMARDVIDRICEDLSVSARSRTRWIRLGVGDLNALRVAVERKSRRLKLHEGAQIHLVRSFGDRALQVLELAEQTGLTAPLVPGHAPLAVEAIYSSRHEMAAHLADLLARRTRLALTDPQAGIGDDSRAAGLIASELGWSPGDTAREIAGHRADVELERALPLGAAASAPPTPSSASA